MERKMKRVWGWLGLVLLLWGLWTAPSWAGLQDDRYDGNIFALYAGNGSLVPPKVTLEKSRQSDRATLLLFYVNDSRDCKQFASTISQLQGYYGRVTDFIAIDVDALPFGAQFSANEAGYYYKGRVPQTLIFDRQGQLRQEFIGVVPFETLDDTFREVFDLLPRSQSLELRPRPVNEINVELVPPPPVKGKKLANETVE
ncbi:thylakoid membrane photosystem I accumulation factor [Thermosynechococcus sp. TA-1]|nr:thylakoid membrane photosystem I accumulation factor [Thermosynechococcus sp. TA-1]